MCGQRRREGRGVCQLGQQPPAPWLWLAPKQGQDVRDCVHGPWGRKLAVLRGSSSAGWDLQVAPCCRPCQRPQESPKQYHHTNATAEAHRGRRSLLPRQVAPALPAGDWTEARRAWLAGGCARRCLQKCRSGRHGGQALCEEAAPPQRILGKGWASTGGIWDANGVEKKGRATGWATDLNRWLRSLLNPECIGRGQGVV